MSLGLLVIDGRPIPRDAAGRYNVSLLHRAAGGEQRHRPKYWLQNAQTSELVAEVEKGGIPPFMAVRVTAGRNGGTFVCRELVYAYAAWVSPKFHLRVLRAFDAVAFGNLAAAADIAAGIVQRDQSSFADASAAARVMNERKQLIPILASEAGTVQLALPFDFGPALTPAVRKRMPLASAMAQIH